MVKFTDSNSAANQKQDLIAATFGRVMAIMMLASAVICVTLPGRARVEAQSQPPYRIASFSAGPGPSAAKIGDLDNDGLNDIAVATLQGSLQLFFNNGRGSFERVSLSSLWPASSNAPGLDIGDLNGDARNDIAVAYSTQRGAVAVMFNQGNRAFASPVNYDLCNSSRGVAIGDLDQDGDNDLADISQCFRSGILLNNGHSGFTFSGTYGNGDDSCSIALADFNRDGFKDIAYLNKALGNVTVMLNNRNATFSPPVWHYAGDLPDDLAIGDFDGDGNIDIAIANSYFSSIILLLNDSSGSFPGYSELAGGDTPTSIVSADLNGDRLLDIAVTSLGNNTLSTIINQGGYNFGNPNTISVGQSPVDVAAGNLDGDSLPDLVSVNQSSGSITVLSSAAAAPPPPPPPAQIMLTASARSTSKAKLADLRWSGATSSKVDIYRNGSRIASVSNTGSYTDQLARRATGTFRYKVCVAGAKDCSNEASVSF